MFFKCLIKFFSFFENESKDVQSNFLKTHLVAMFIVHFYSLYLEKCCPSSEKDTLKNIEKYPNLFSPLS